MQKALAELKASTIRVAWAPNPGPQEAFLRTSAYECLYGGARGGGKTDALLADACRQVDANAVLPRVLKANPGMDHFEALALAKEASSQYRAMIFRRTLVELTDLIQRARIKIPQWFPGAKWKAQEKMFVFPSGATLKFAYLRQKSDWMHYQGWEIHFLGFEELTHFEYEAYINISSSCRTSNPYIVCSIRATTNPGGPGHSWVRSRFVDAAPWGQKFVDPETGLTRQFIPAKVQDNPKLMQADPLYVKRLMALPEQERKAMLDGDWDAWEGAVFAFTRKLHVIDWHDLTWLTGEGLYKIPDWWPLIMAMDWGFGKPFSIGWWTVDPHGRMIRLREWYGCKRKGDGTPEPNQGLRMVDKKVAEGILERERSWGWQGRSITRLADPSMFYRRRIAADIEGPPLAEEYAIAGVSMIAADNDRISGKQQLHKRLQLWPMDADHETPAIFVLEGCKDWLRTVPSLPADPDNPEDIDTEAEDHAYDETRYALMSRPFQPTEPVKDKRWKKKQQEERRGWKG